MKLLNKTSSTLTPSNEQYVKAVDDAVNQIRDTMTDIGVNDAVTVTITKHDGNSGVLDINRWAAVNVEGDALRLAHKGVTLNNVTYSDAFTTMCFFQPHLTNLVSDGAGCVSATKELPDNCSSVFTELAE